MKEQILAMGKTPSELIKMGVAEFHIRAWITDALASLYPKYGVKYGAYYLENCVCGGNIQSLINLYSVNIR